MPANNFRYAMRLLSTIQHCSHLNVADTAIHDGTKVNASDILTHGIGGGTAQSVPAVLHRICLRVSIDRSWPCVDLLRQRQ